MHQIHHTRGIILSSTPFGESNRFYKIFTEEFGLVFAAAQSVREQKSKLRYTLQDFGFIFVDLVRGKEIWCIVGAEEGYVIKKSRNQEIKIIAQACILITRLVHGERKEDKLFSDILGVINFLGRYELPPSLFRALETLISFRTLVYLGYMDMNGYEKFLTPADYSLEIIQEFNLLCSGIIPKINSALRGSHL